MKNKPIVSIRIMSEKENKILEKAITQAAIKDWSKEMEIYEKERNKVREEE